MDLNRRTLLKVLGLTAAGSALPGCEREVHNLVPYLLPDDHIVPGVATWYATTCQECEAGCGILARVMEGRIKKLEGNPEHPINKGKLCAMGQAGLQGVYNPDRLTHPLMREGKRGDGHWRAITWEEGIETWVAKLQSHRQSTCLITRPVNGSLATLFDKVMGHVSGRILIQESREDHTLRAATAQSFGVNTLPFYDLAQADYVLSFGAPFLEHWLSPVAYGIAFGQFRQGRPTVRGRYIQIEPRLSLTAANADQWIPITPGTEGLIAIGIGQVLIQESLTRTASPLSPSMNDIFFSSSLDAIAAKTDILPKTIRQLTREIASAGAPVILGGGPASSHTNSTITLTLLSALNFLLGNVDQPGGLQWRTQPPFPVPAANMTLSSDRHFSALADSFGRADYTLLHLYRADPLFTLPPSTNIEHVFTQARFIVSFSSFLDDSTSRADLILPDHDPLESWGDHVFQDGSPQPVLSLSQPVIRPLYDTRAIGDVWLEAARQLGEPLSSELPWRSLKDMMQATWVPFLQAQEGDGPADNLWRLALQRGGCWPDTSLSSETNLPPEVLAYEEPQFVGQADAYPFYFYPFLSLALYDGRGANRPWLQELPDPLTTHMWGSWIEINPRTAGQLNIHHGDIARITSQYGAVDAPVVFYPGLRPDMLAMPIGQGHRTYGRYAEERGSNPLTLIGPAYDPLSGSIATGATRVNITRISSGRQLPMLERSGNTPFQNHLHQTGGL
jgi:anaerobic selenocysteine-containing dehydrogenase